MKIARISFTRTTTSVQTVTHELEVRDDVAERLQSNPEEMRPWMENTVRMLIPIEAWSEPKVTKRTTEVTESEVVASKIKPEDVR